jgi:hypothetical protein
MWPIEKMYMVINECKLSTMDQFDPTKVVKQDVSSGEYFVSYILNLMPGQEVPARTHADKSVILIPQMGSATLFTEDASETTVEMGSIYTDHCGRNFGLRNIGTTPFQVLIILITAPAD